jgi:hypothetical protein
MFTTKIPEESGRPIFLMDGNDLYWIKYPHGSWRAARSVIKLKFSASALGTAKRQYVVVESMFPQNRGRVTNPSILLSALSAGIGARGSSAISCLIRRLQSMPKS